MSRSRAVLPVLGLAVVSAVVSLLVAEVVFPALSWNRDEPVYLWQVEVLRSGRLTGTDGGAPQFFRPWLTAAVDGTLVSQYTLGWPLVLLAATVVLGTPQAALAAGTALAVVGVHAFAAVATGDRRTALLSAALFLACPVVLVQSGLHLGYLFTMGLGLLFVAALLRGAERRSPRLLVAAGALVGWIFMTRPLDAVLWGVAGFGYLLVDRLRPWRSLAGVAGWFTAGSLPLVLATLAYNWRVTGAPAEFPITAADPLDTLGFGLRRIMPANLPVDFGLVQAIKGSGRNALSVPLFLVGGWLGAVLVAFGLWSRRHDRRTLLLIAVAAAFPLGYFTFWGTFLSAAYAKYSGPYYYLPVFAPSCVLVAEVVLHALRRRRPVGAALVAALVLVSAPLALWHLDRNRDISRAQLPWKDAESAVPRGEDALVFVADSGPYLLFSNPYASNGPALDDRVLFAADRGARNLDLLDRLPSRVAYLQRSSLPTWRLLEYDRPRAPTIALERIEVVEGDFLAITARITNRTDARVVGASLDDGTTVAYRQVSDTSSRGATHAMTWTLALPGGVEGSDLTLAEDAARLGQLTVTVGFGATLEAAAANPRLRHVLGFRRSSAAVEVLTPGKWQRLVDRRDGTKDWVPAPERRAQLSVVVGDPAG